jgi:hypothetical protein
VGRQPLDVQQGVGVAADGLDQRDERHLRRVALVVEQPLAGEQPADRHAVETAGQRPVGVPRLDAVRPSLPVQPHVRLPDVGVDPAAGARRIGAGVDHRLERLVDGHPVAGARSPQRPTHAQAVERDDPARVRRPPRQHVRAPGAHRHREQPGAVRGEDRVGLEIGADPDDAVLVSGVRRGEGPVGRGSYFWL